MADTLVFALPPVPGPGTNETHWWHLADGTILESGYGEEWLQLGSDGKEFVRVALAPAALVRVGYREAPASATLRQAAAVARSVAVEASLGSPETLHAVAAPAGEEGERVATAVVDNGLMLAWLEWTRQLGAEPDHVIPVSALLPFSEAWTEATFGSERVVGRREMMLPAEPELAGRIVGDAQVDALGEADIDAALIAAADRPPLDLRTGRFARRRRTGLDRARIRELLFLAALIPLIALAWSLAGILKLESSTGRLDSRTLATAESALGRPVTLDTAEAEMAQQLGGSAHCGPMPLLAILYQAIEPEESVSATEISYRGDGILSVTLAAPSVDPINRLLVALQRNNYRITAVPRQSPDGRAMVDATVRGGP